MPWYITIILGFCFLAAGVVQWGYEHQVEKRFHAGNNYFFLDSKGNRMHESFSPEFFKEYKIVKKKAAK